MSVTCAVQMKNYIFVAFLDPLLHDSAVAAGSLFLWMCKEAILSWRLYQNLQDIRQFAVNPKKNSTILHHIFMSLYNTMYEELAASIAGFEARCCEVVRRFWLARPEAAAQRRFDLKSSFFKAL